MPNPTEQAGVYYCTKHSGICNEDSDRCDFAGTHPRDPELGDTDTCFNCHAPISFENDGGEDDFWVHGDHGKSECHLNCPEGLYAEPTDDCVLHPCYYDPQEILGSAPPVQTIGTYNTVTGVFTPKETS